MSIMCQTKLPCCSYYLMLICALYAVIPPRRALAYWRREVYFGFLVPTRTRTVLMTLSMQLLSRCFDYTDG